MNESVMYAEVYEILNMLGNDYISKIPNSLYKFIDENRNKNIVVKFNINIPIENQKIENETIEFISLLNLQYWSTKEQQDVLNEIYRNNEINYRKEINQKYDPNNIFQNLKQQRKLSQDNNNQVSMVEYKQSLFEKIIEKIKKIINRFK